MCFIIGVAVGTWGESDLGVQSADLDLGVQEPTHVPAEPHVAVAVRRAYRMTYDVDEGEPVLADEEVFPNLGGAKLDQEGTAWKLSATEKGWARFVRENTHVAGLESAFADPTSFMQVAEMMRQSCPGQKKTFSLQHGFEGQNMEQHLAAFSTEDIIFGMMVKYEKDEGYDAGGLSRQGVEALALACTSICMHYHSHAPLGVQHLYYTIA